MNTKLFLQGITHEDVLWSFEISTYVENIVGCPHVTYNYYLTDTNSINRSPLSQKRILDSLIILDKKALHLFETKYAFFVGSTYLKDKYL